MSAITSHILEVLRKKDNGRLGKAVLGQGILNEDDLGNCTRIFQLKDLPLNPESISLFQKISDSLKQKLQNFSPIANEDNLNFIDSLINDSLGILKNDKEWQTILSTIEESQKRDQFERNISTAFMFKALSSIYTSQSVPKETAQFLRIAANTQDKPEFERLTQLSDQLIKIKLMIQEKKLIEALDNLQKSPQKLSTEDSKLKQSLTVVAASVLQNVKDYLNNNNLALPELTNKLKNAAMRIDALTAGRMDTGMVVKSTREKTSTDLLNLANLTRETASVVIANTDFKTPMQEVSTRNRR